MLYQFLPIRKKFLREGIKKADVCSSSVTRDRIALMKSACERPSAVFIVEGASSSDWTMSAGITEGK